jgi:dihydrodipicolinate synthase/N-acetylneuraminate lyase
MLKGFVPAVVTPFNPSGDIQFADFETIIRGCN